MLSDILVGGGCESTQHQLHSWTDRMKDVVFHWDTHFGFGAGGDGLHRFVLRGQKLGHVATLKSGEM